MKPEAASLSAAPTSVPPQIVSTTYDRFFDRQRIIASPEFNRWLVPPAALAIHLCIGTAYGFSVFLQPLSRVLGVTAPVRCASHMSLWDVLFTTDCDWRISDLGWIYTLFFVFLGRAMPEFG